MSRTKKRSAERKPPAPSSASPLRTVEPRPGFVARPLRPNRLFLWITIILLGMWMALLAWLASR